jgi:hypothetical protein
MKMMTRKKVRPRSLRFSSSAMPIAIGPCTTSDRTTTKRLCPIAERKTGSLRALR